MSRRGGIPAVQGREEVNARFRRHLEAAQAPMSRRGGIPAVQGREEVNMKGPQPMADIGDGMTFDQYQEAAATTAIYPDRGSVGGLAYIALGLGEAGEIQNKVKKILRDHGGELTDEMRLALAKEAGDLLWYIAQLSEEIGIPLSDIASGNLSKLVSRKVRGTLTGNGDER